MRKSISLFFLLLIFIPFVLSADVQPNPANDPALRLVISENLKTREELKNYLDKKAGDVAQVMQKTIDDDIVLLAQRWNDMLLKASIKFGIIWFSTTFLANLVTELVFRKIYARAHKSRKFQEENAPVPKPTAQMRHSVQDIYDKAVTSRPVAEDSVFPSSLSNDMEMMTGGTTIPKMPLVSSSYPGSSPPIPKKGFWNRRKEQKLLEKESKKQHELAKKLPVMMSPPQPSYIDKTEERIQSAFERLQMGG